MVSRAATITVTTGLLGTGITILGMGVEQITKGNYEIGVPLAIVGLGIAGLGVYLQERGIIETLKEWMYTI